jgi:sugar phosphate isomerase/epimerase
MKLSVVLSTHAARFNAVAFKGDLQSNLEKIAAWGYDGAELAIRAPGLVDAAELWGAVTGCGLVVPAIGTGQAYSEEGLSLTASDPSVSTAALERLKLHVPLAAHLKSLVIIGLIRGVTPKGVAQADAMDSLVESLKDLCEAAAEQHVRLALEPINRYETDLVNSVDSGLKLIDQVGAENLGLLLDTFHMNIEEAVIEDSIRACGERIFHFHVADSNRWYPGAGHLNFRSILDTLAATGYDGFVSGEFMPRPDADTAAKSCIQYLRGL